jgi:hypothetical protein
MQLKKLIKPLPYLLFALIVLGCEKDANIKLPKAEPKLVIGSFISPQDTIIKVTVSKSTPIFNQNNTNGQNTVLTDASVILSSGSKSIQLPYNSIERSYQVDASLFPILAGNKYHLSVTTPDGFKASASCIIPLLPVNSLQLSIDSAIVNENGVNQIRYNFTASWNDTPGRADYYRIVGEKLLYDTYAMQYSYMTAVSALTTDAYEDGKTLTRKYGFPYEYRRLISLDVYLLNTDDAYYKYFDSRSKFSGDDPFSEPVQIFTNVTGGLGIFAGFQQVKKRIYLK